MEKILVIEDTYEVRDNLAELLGLSGYEVHTAADGREGVKLALSIKPDLILCDIMMPSMDGFGVARILSSQSATSHIPFIFLTAKGEREDFRKGMNLGADDYITKPFNDVELLDAIKMRLQKSKRLQEITGGNVPLDNGEGIPELESLRQGRELRDFPIKTELFSEGQHPRYLYYLHSGQVKLSRDNGRGKEFVTHIRHAGGFLGYGALVRGGRYAESAVALEEVEASLIPKADFLEALYGSQQLSAYFMRMLAGNVHEREERLLQLAYDTIRERVAAALLNLDQHCHGQGICILRKDLAALVGTATETLARTIRGFRDDGLIQIKGSEIIVLDPEGLERVGE